MSSIKPASDDSTKKSISDSIACENFDLALYSIDQEIKRCSMEEVKKEINPELELVVLYLNRCCVMLLLHRPRDALLDACRAYMVQQRASFVSFVSECQCAYLKAKTLFRLSQAFAGLGQPFLASEGYTRAHRHTSASASSIASLASTAVREKWQVLAGQVRAASDELMGLALPLPLPLTKDTQSKQNHHHDNDHMNRDSNRELHRLRFDEAFESYCAELRATGENRGSNGKDIGNPDRHVIGHNGTNRGDGKKGTDHNDSEDEFDFPYLCHMDETHADHATFTTPHTPATASPSPTTPPSEYHRLIDHMEANGARLSRKTYLHCQSANDRSILTLDNIHRGEQIMFIPFQLLLSVPLAKESALGRKLVPLLRGRGGKNKGKEAHHHASQPKSKGKHKAHKATEKGNTKGSAATSATASCLSSDQAILAAFMVYEKLRNQPVHSKSTANDMDAAKTAADTNTPASANERRYRHRIGHAKKNCAGRIHPSSPSSYRSSVLTTYPASFPGHPINWNDAERKRIDGSSLSQLLDIQERKVQADFELICGASSEFKSLGRRLRKLERKTLKLENEKNTQNGKNTADDNNDDNDNNADIHQHEGDDNGSTGNKDAGVREDPLYREFVWAVLCINSRCFQFQYQGNTSHVQNLSTSTRPPVPSPVMS